LDFRPDDGLRHRLWERGRRDSGAAAVQLGHINKDHQVGWDFDGQSALALQNADSVECVDKSRDFARMIGNAAAHSRHHSSRHSISRRRSESGRCAAAFGNGGESGSPASGRRQ
jgi:hypothetical protein